MKLVAFFLLFLLPALVHSQSLFFDDLDSATWVTIEQISDSTLENSKTISIKKLVEPLSFIKQDLTFWKFRNGELTLERLSVGSQEIISTQHYDYEILKDSKTSIVIKLNNEMIAQYTVGIISTGHHALLFNKNKKRNRSN